MAVGYNHGHAMAANNDAKELEALGRLLEAYGRGEWDTPRTGVSQGLLEKVDHAFARARTEEQAAKDRLTVDMEKAVDALVGLVIQGDLSAPELKGTKEDLLLPLYAAVNQSALLLRGFVTTMAQAVRDITSGVGSVNTQLAKTEQLLGEQATTTQELAATLTELSTASREIEDSTGAVAKMAQDSLRSTERGSKAAKHFNELMQLVRSSAGQVNDSVRKLADAVQRVGAVTDLITEVADRSDVLALNAALEAARAGEAGQGFGIVADEMRRMSSRVLASTAEVKALVETIRTATAQVHAEASTNVETALKGEKQAQEALAELGLIGLAVRDTTEATLSIQHATAQQRSATSQAAEAVGSLSQEARTALDASRSVREAASSLTTLATTLTDLVRRFQLPSGG